ncbi:hypothetical protein I4U23_029365 [Adineta vaga]|nr:hypothetical protein I4U23_029365 [Adineta vaga]
MGNTCKSAKTDSTIRTIVEPSVPIAAEEIPESTTTKITTTKVYQSADGSTIHTEEKKEEITRIES